MQSGKNENQATDKALAPMNVRRVKLSPGFSRNRAFSIHIVISLAAFKVAIS
jgi:hypothetical protein